MFCDLVGSTGVSAQLDAEDWRELVGSYLDAASAGVTEMGGPVAKKSGDGLMAPQAHSQGRPIALTKAKRRARRVHPRSHRPEPSQDGQADPDAHLETRIGTA
jgi:class 3 adenylate cyclase